MSPGQWREDGSEKGIVRFLCDPEYRVCEDQMNTILAGIIIDITEKKSFFRAVEGIFYPHFLPGEVVLDLNAVLRVMPQKVSLQVENSNSMSKVKLAAGFTHGGKGQVQAGANLPLCKGSRTCVRLLPSAEAGAGILG